MNKKFSTLLAAIALIGSMSANAQELTAVEQGEAISLAKGSALSGLTKDTKNGLYQLKTADGKFLVMEEVTEGSGDYKLSAKLDGFDIENSLWCVTVASYNQGQAVKFDFMNKGTGMMLDLSMTGAAGYKEGETWVPVMGGEISGWAFSKTVETLEPRMPLYSGFTTDSVVGLKVQADGAVAAAKYLRSKVKVDNSETPAADANTFTGFTLYYADEVALTETQLNTLFTIQADAKAGVTLKFSPDIKGTSLKNPFNAQKFIAKDSEDNLNGIGNWLYVGQKDKDAYLKVDTAYTNTTGVKFLAYGWTEAKDDVKAIDRVKASDIKDQHKFMFVYSPSKDDLKIYVKQITWKADSESKKYWREVVKADEVLNPEDLTASHKRGNWCVSLQDLIKDETRILTVDAKNQNTKISLGYGGCDPVEQTKTTLADGVYYIMNSAGKYLASPIYKNGKIEWTTVNPDEQNVAHMPAYQWVILKKNQNDKTNTSAVELINREYPNKDNAANYTLNLNKKEGGNYYYVTIDVPVTGDNNNANASILKTDSLSFDLIPEASVKDSLLGYKNLTNGELLVNKYTFNYWHPYAADRYIAQSSKDSTLTVNAGMSAFKLDTADRGVKNYAVEKFGYTVSKDVQARIKGLKQLYRTAYVVTLDGKSLAINKEAKFNATKADYTDEDGNTPATPFFFKENNQITETGKCYYAILSTYKKDNENYYYIDTKNKAGVSDYDGAATLKAQVLNETRTSAFAIEPDNTPLYRRFDSAELEGNEGDKADTLRFIEKYRREYLQVENNKNFMNGDIDFLGIYTPEKTDNGLSFIVDTAWVNRGAGNIKPQYLISIDRDDFLGTPGIPCSYTHNHYDNEGNKVDAEHCSHATPAIPGFERGKYLINFHDFASKHDNGIAANKKDATYMWKKYDRAGFVEAVRVADTLFILRDQFKNLKNEEITIEALNKAEAEALAAAKKAGVKEKNFVSYKYVLSGDNHKYVTWSMRFVDKNKAANEVEADRSFLFESMAADIKDAIAPKKAAWLKMQNGCLVMSDDSDSSFDEMNTGGDDALIFNVEQGDDIATDTETINVAEGVSVVANDGTVTIQGAAGKSVVISNILGKVVAETVLSSDNATISVPAGIVAVAVEGEAAVKVVVK